MASVVSEVFHRFRYGNTQFFAQTEEMVNSGACRENNGSVLGYGYFLLSEFFGGQTFYFDKRTKNDIYTMIFLQYRSREIFRNSGLG